MRKMAPFRYWGGKVRMAPWIIQGLPPHDHYVEACAGSAAIMALKPPVAAETLNDTYDEVVNFFRVLQDEPSCEQLIDFVAFTPYAHSEFREALDMQLTPDSDDPGPIWRAWAFFTRMQMAVVPGRTGWSYSVNGASGKKANKPGRWATMPEHLLRIAERFERVQITQWDVVELITRLDSPGVLILVDPPYIGDSRPRSTGTSSGYVHDSFDHGAFVEAMLQSKHASFAITHYRHPFYDELPGVVVYGDYDSHRNIPNGAGRDVTPERLYILDRSLQ